MEIERKYEVKQLPEHLDSFTCKKMEQGYLCHNPILRIRKSNEDYVLTYKSKTDLTEKPDGAIIRNEAELPLTREAYETLRTKTEGNMVYKTRYLIPLDKELTAELDVFEGVLSGLTIVEVEFEDIEASDAFVPPLWFGKELSLDRRFSNYHLSKLSSINDLFL